MIVQIMGSKVVVLLQMLWKVAWCRQENSHDVIPWLLLSTLGMEERNLASYHCPAPQRHYVKWHNEQ